MRRLTIYSEDWESLHGTHMTRRDALRNARKEAPWASVMIKVDGGYVCFETWTDAVNVSGKDYEQIKRFATNF